MIRAGLIPHTITARYHARCLTCDNRIIPGDTVLYMPKQGVRCRACGRAYQAKAVMAEIAAVDARAHERRTRAPDD